MFRAVSAAAVLAVVATGCSAGTADPGGQAEAEAETAGKGRSVRVIGDGSTAFTGTQPNQPEFAKLTAGRTPPQFVVFSWDGAGEDGQGLFSRFRKVARENDASMTYFLSGLYLLPESKRTAYAPPGRPRGASDIELLSDGHLRDTLAQVRGAWLEGNEIGTHFNGHFCGSTGVAGWSKEQWKSEIAQAKQFVKQWKTNTGWSTARPLPFDYDRELVGARTPCLEGRDNLVQAAGELGWRYDSSGVNYQQWPAKRHGIWDLSMQKVPFPGSDDEELTMDYNFMVNPLTSRGAAEQQMRDGLLAGFDRAYQGNRAPLIIGNHFENWNGGAYMRAIEDVVETVCRKKDVRCVSFRQLADWLDAQDPQTLAKLRRLEVGQRPEQGWAAYLGG